MTIDVGLARADITAFAPGLLLMGWAVPQNRGESVGDRLQARALALRQRGRTVVLVCAELCFPTQALRHEVAARIGDLALDDSDWMLTATHNHSGPSGLSHALLYTMFQHGFHQGVLDQVADGIAACIRDAIARLEPGRLRWTRHRMPAALGVNRAWRAWNRNRGVQPVTAATRHLAVCREATLLAVESRDGKPLGAVHWFGLHGTTIHADNRAVRHDHKGTSSRLWEANPPPGARDFVAIFAQAPTGDVTPNHTLDPARGVHAFDTDDLRARATVGRLQYAAAAAAWERGERIADDARLEGALRWLPMEERPVDADLAEGSDRAPRTTRATVGFGAPMGTLEGPGPLGDARWLVDATTRLRRAQRAVAKLAGHSVRDAPRLPLLDVGLGMRGFALGVLPLRRLHIPASLDPALHYALRAGRSGLGDHPWVPTTLPLQLLRIGPLMLVGLPNEPSTMAGRRLRGTVEAELAQAGIAHVIVQGYANGYSSYCVTAEEFEQQSYEGAMTLFGRWTLAAWRTEARRLARDLRSGRAHTDPGPGPWLLPEAALRAQPPTPSAP